MRYREGGGGGMGSASRGLQCLGKRKRRKGNGIMAQGLWEGGIGMVSGGMSEGGWGGETGRARREKGIGVNGRRRT